MRQEALEALSKLVAAALAAHADVVESPATRSDAGWAPCSCALRGLGVARGGLGLGAVLGIYWSQTGICTFIFLESGMVLVCESGIGTFDSSQTVRL